MENNYFEVLNGLNVNGHTEKKKAGSTELTYLSWAWAVAEVLKKFPDMTYRIVKFQDKDGNWLPYMYDENTGYMCMTEVTLAGITREMWLPVMDSANRAMKKERYTYKVKDYYNKDGYKEKEVEPATMFDINKTIMRCLTKNFAMFGLGLYIFAGEDLPESDEDQDKGNDPNKEPEKTPAQKAAETRKAREEEFKQRFASMYAYMTTNPKWSYAMEERFNATMKEAVAKNYEQEKCSQMLEIFDKLEKDSITY